MHTEQPVHRTRLAPTPSGYLHLGNVLSFAITAFLARKAGAKILLRIDDLDQQRVKKNYIQDIFDSLDFLDIPWDEGPMSYREYEQEYSQVHRMDLYVNALRQLKEQGLVFACDCTRTQIIQHNPSGCYPGTCSNRNLSMDKEQLSWRLHTETAGDNFPETMCSFIVKKKDGYPAYQLTSVLDDQHFGVDLIVRGTDLLPSTQAQLFLAGQLNIPSFINSRFYHHPLLMGNSGQKLSKSAGDISVQFLRKEGYQPAAVFSRIGRMLGLETAVSNWQALAEAASASI